MFDHNGDGQIDVSELNSIGKQRRKLGHKSGEWTQEKNEKLVRKLDADGDGFVTSRDFVQYYINLHSKASSWDFVEVVRKYMEVCCVLTYLQSIGVCC